MISEKIKRTKLKHVKKEKLDGERKILYEDKRAKKIKTREIAVVEKKGDSLMGKGRRETDRLKVKGE